MTTVIESMRSIVAKRAAVDVVVPVYLGLDETRACVESVIVAKNESPMRLLVIEDGSPDPAIREWLRESVRQKSWLKVTQLSNRRNQGFTATVNRGMSMSRWRDVVLLNSDTLVSDFWLDRLRDHAYSEGRIATVTPFSNNATIASFPDFCADNPMPDSEQTGLLAQAAWRANQGQHVEIPTAIGFCMYITRACIRETGMFDVANFGKGYGEENDFCMRATKAGWRHLLAADTFVAHIGAVSFSVSSEQRKRKAEQVLNGLHPEYNGLVRRFIADDPIATYRHRFSLALKEMSTLKQTRRG